MINRNYAKLMYTVSKTAETGKSLEGNEWERLTLFQRQLLAVGNAWLWEMHNCQ